MTPTMTAPTTKPPTATVDWAAKFQAAQAARARNPKDQRELYALLRLDPAFAEADDKLRDMEALRVRVVRRLDTNRAGMNDLERQREAENLDERARGLLVAGGAIGIDPLEAQRERLRREQTAIRDELTVVERAIAIQREAREALRGPLCRAICEALRPEYRRLIQQIAHAMERMSEALRAERLLREDLAAADVSFVAYLPPMPFNHCNLDDENAAGSRWMAEARRDGLLLE